MWAGEEKLEMLHMMFTRAFQSIYAKSCMSKRQQSLMVEWLEQASHDMKCTVMIWRS